MSQGFTKGTPIDTDPTLSLNSDIVVPSQSAVKTYVDTGLATKVPTTRNLTINGTTYDLSADRSWTIAAGISGSGTTNEIAYFTAASTLSSLTTVTYPSLTELSYVKGVTSAIQTQINGKQNTIGLTTVGTNLATLPDPSAIRYLRINADNTVSAISLAQLKTDLSAVSVQYSLVTTNQTNVGTTFENVTELSFAVTANKTYRWSATISFTVATGFIMFSTNGPTASFATSRFMWSSTTVTTNTITNQVAYDSGTNAVAASNAVCTGDGLFRVTASGTWTIRFRCASAASLTVRAGSLVEYQEVL